MQTSDKRTGRGPAGTPPQGTPRRFPLLLVFGVLATLWMLQSFGRIGAQSPIRYDEFRRFVSEGRVEWVQLGSEEIRGAFRRGKAPKALKGSDGAKAEPSRVLFTTSRVSDSQILRLLEAHRVAYRGVNDSPMSSQWPWFVYLLLSLGISMLLWGGVFRKMGGQAGGVLSFGKSRGKVFQENDVKVTFVDVAGVDEAKDELQEVIEFLRSPEKYTRIGAKIPKGLLLVGPPGTGKTLLARAVAGEAKVPFISISGSEFVEMFVGVGAARVRDLFEQAARSAPCIVFIDELDAIGRSRGGAALGGGGNEEREQTLNQLLVEMDGFEPHNAVIIMAATNRPEVLDPALLRPGRFDRQVLVDRPDRVGREEILRVHANGVALAAEVDLALIAARTPGFAGADLANLVNEAALRAARHGRSHVTMADFSDAIERVVAGLEKKTRIMGEEERVRIAYHEVGHALAGQLSGDGDSVHKISIVPRGLAALGYTMQLPTQERYLMTASAIRAKLVGLLGGRAAEEIVFNEASTGAQNDILRATDIARAMVVDYGMSERVGAIAVGTERPAFLGTAAHPGGVAMTKPIGDTLANLIDAETQRLVEEARERARELLIDNRPALDRIAGRLLEAEQLEGEELKRLLDQAKRDHEALTRSKGTSGLVRTRSGAST